MFPRIVSGCVLTLLLASSAWAEEPPFGDLDFSKMTKPQEQFFWKRLKSLALEEAVIAYCGQPDDFETRAKQGIRACVTAEALNKAETFFKSELSATKESLGARKASCRAKPEPTSGWLGIDIAPVENGAGAGALVAGALEGSPAAASDLKTGDVIRQVNGVIVGSPKELSAKIRALSPGATVTLGVLRDGAGRSVSVKLGAQAFDAQGRVALDLASMIEPSKHDLKSVSDEVADMCQKCKTSIWAIFCH